MEADRGIRLPEKEVLASAKLLASAAMLRAEERGGGWQSLSWMVQLAATPTHALAKLLSWREASPAKPMISGIPRCLLRAALNSTP